MGDLINAFTFADSKLWRTLKLIHMKPGRYSVNFMDGKRVHYMKPIALFFLANVLYFFYPLTNTFNTTLATQMKAFPFLHSGIATEMVDARLEKSTIKPDTYDQRFKEFALRYDTKTTELSKLLLIVMAMLITPFFWFIHYRKQPEIAHHFILSLEVMIFVILFCVQLLGLIFFLVFAKISPALITEGNTSAIIGICILIFFIQLERNFFHNRLAKAVLNSLLTFTGFVLSLFLYRATLFFVTFWVL